MVGVPFVVFVVSPRICPTLRGAVARGAANSVLLAAVTHTFFNRSNNLDGIVADALTGPNRQVAALATAVVLTVAVCLVIRRRLTRAHRVELDAAEHTSQPTPVLNARSPR